jgi:hypothetical protein
MGSKLNWALIAGAALFLAACGSTGGGGGGGAGGGGSGQLAGSNALIAPFPAFGVPGTTSPTSATYSVDQDGSIDVSWEGGPLSDETRTFEHWSGGEYFLDHVGEQGLLTINRSGAYSASVSVLVTPEDYSTGAMGLAHAGVAPTNIPTSGTLSYARNGGVTVVPLSQNCGASSACVGDVNIAANFSSGAVNGTFSNFNSGFDDIGFSGSMNTGNALYSATSLTLGGSSASGKLIGGFYGPSVAETAGVFDFTEDGTRYLGNYVAARQ